MARFSTPCQARHTVLWPRQATRGCAFVLLLGCVHTPSGLTSKPAFLRLPPPPETLANLRGDLKSSSCERRQEAILHLLDLHDAVMATSGEVDEVDEAQRTLSRTSRRVANSALGLFELAGAAARRQALLRLLRSPSCESEAARRAVQLLMADTLPRTNHRERFHRALAYKRFIVQGGRFTGNVRLRLVTWCERAFRSALRTAPARQADQLNGCLYALFDADPGAYFHTLPTERPPDPPWHILREELTRQLKKLRQGRFRVVASMQLRQDNLFFRRAGSRLPASILLSRLMLPTASRSRAFDRQPLVVASTRGYLIDGMTAALGDEATLAKALRRRTAQDPRKEIFVALANNQPVAPLFTLVRVARRIGMRRILLAVRKKVAPTVPGGDAHARIIGTGPLWRLQGLPLSIRMIGVGAGQPDRRHRKGADFDPRMMPNGLALSISKQGVRVSSRDGTLLWAVAKLSSRLESVKLALASLHRAYPGDAGILLAVSGDTPYFEVVRALEVLRSTTKSGPLFVGGAALIPFYSLAPEPRDAKPIVQALANLTIHAAPRQPAQVLRRARPCFADYLRRQLAAGDGDLPAAKAFSLTRTGLPRPGTPPQLAKCLATLSWPATPPQSLSFRVSTGKGHTP